MATEEELSIVARAIDVLGGRRTAEFIAERLTATQFTNLVGLINDRRKAFKNAGIQQEIDALMATLEP